MPCRTYDLEDCEAFISAYEAIGGHVATVEEGVLGLGVVICDGRGTKYRSYVIRERYVNEWTSTHTVRGYRILPKKWADAVDRL